MVTQEAQTQAWLVPTPQSRGFGFFVCFTLCFVLFLALTRASWVAITGKQKNKCKLTDLTSVTLLDQNKKQVRARDISSVVLEEILYLKNL